MGNVSLSPLIVLSVEQPLQIELRVERVTDQDPEFLQFVHRSGLQPRSKVTVDVFDRAADAVTLRTEHGTVTIGTQAASKILAKPTAPPKPKAL